MLAGVASIKAQQTRMSVIGNNLANINTTAYKSNRVLFEEMLSQTLKGASRPTGTSGGTNATQYGLGVLIGGTDVNNSQGSLNATNRQSDLAIQGSGYFMVSNGESTSYTRDGSFDLDASGDLVHRGTGERVLGWTANPATGIIDPSKPLDAKSYINIPLGSRTAVQATTKVEFAGNLDSRAFTDTGTASTTATVRVYDSLGTAHDLNLSMTEGTAPNTWKYAVTGANGDTVANGTGTVTFDASTGALTSGSPANITVTPAATTGVPAFSMALDFSKFSQVAADTGIQASNQNGYAPGSLSSFSINPDGTIIGLYTNGLTRPIAELGMSNFPNPDGLERTGNNLWRASDNSGIPVVGTATTGGRGVISSGFLEQSNVDISNEFADLIVTQRGFQANTKVVTVVDELLQDVINMKR